MNLWYDTASRQLQEEVAVVTQRHQFELNGCLERWLQQQQQCLLQDAKGDLPGSPCLPFDDVTQPSGNADVLTELNIVPGGSVEAAKPPKQVPLEVNTEVDGEARHLGAFGDSQQAHKQLKSPKKVPTQSYLQHDKSLFNLEGKHQPSAIQALVRSKHYEAFSTTLILLNSCFVGWHVQYIAERARDDALIGLAEISAEPGWIFGVQTSFCFLFTLELALRWAATGFLDFWVVRGGHHKEQHELNFLSRFGIRGFHNELWWNLLDLFIVSFGVFDLFMEMVARATQSEKSGIAGKVSILRVLRVVRVVRIARVIRVMRFFRELRMMIFSILGSMKSVIWVMAVLGITFYIFGITFTAAVTDYLDSIAKWQSEEHEFMILYFGTVDRSILSLYMAMSGGNDWGQFYDSLAPLWIGYRLAFLMFITFSLFAVVNIVTGVFVESAMQANTTDREIIVHEEMHVRREYLAQMQSLFEEMDDDDIGTITLDEFEKKLSDERVIAYFNAMKLDVSEARVLFRLLDFDQSDEISIQEFLEGCYRFQGESRSLDMKIMQYEVRYLQESFAVFQEMLKALHEHILPRGKRA